jgi:hypothetical protein
MGNTATDPANQVSLLLPIILRDKDIDMSAIQTRIPVIGLLFIFLLLSGVWLSNSGKPLNTLIFTIHKLIALATVIVLAVAIYQSRTAVEMNAAIWVAIIVTGLLFVAMFVTGALLSIIQPTNEVVLTIHRVIPFLVAISTAATVYLMVNSQS